MAESRSALTFALWLASWLFSSGMAFLAAAAIFVSTVYAQAQQTQSAPGGRVIVIGEGSVSVTAGPSDRTISPHPSSREGHHSTAGWSSISFYCI